MLFMSDVLTIRVDRRTKGRLEKLAKRLALTRSKVAAEAVRAYLDLNDWQVERIKAGIKAADAGDFATEEEVKAIVKKWTRRAR